MKIFLTGFMGSGKTYWGKKWSENNKLTFFDLDEQIESITGDTVANLFEKKGEAYFRETERHALREFDVKFNFILACGGGTPCFFQNMEWMNEHGITFYLRASAQEIFRRLMNETHERPLLKKVNPAELLFFIEQKVKEREPFYLQAKHILDAGTLTINSITDTLNRK